MSNLASAMELPENEENLPKTYDDIQCYAMHVRHMKWYKMYVSNREGYSFTQLHIRQHWDQAFIVTNR